ncbi:MAG: CBS domain-containing protein [Anaerolineae bacterium]|nr:CBS domain-containing protein [Anaerolineales bacterium]MCQ3979775.1 histidine kinase [Anaerolineae bacterium]
MKTVRQLLQTKGTEVWSIGPEALVIEALKVMAEKGVGALVVLDAGRVVGILSERDYARKVSLLGKSSKTTPVREIMTEKVVFVRPEQTVEDCMALMTSKRIRHLPVMDGDRLIGVISIGDVVKEVISHQEFLIGQLENYITGR